jgi:hypothetical protein
VGKPVKIVDLARQMIELSGLKPDADIQIEFTGIRPGEKLFEEITHQGEQFVPTNHSKIFRFLSANVELAELRRTISNFRTNLHLASSVAKDFPSGLKTLAGSTRRTCRCQLFSDRSAVNLQKAVDEINQNEGAARVVLALVPLGPENPALAPKAWLCGIGDDLSPQDPVRAARHLACDRFEPDPIQRETC